MWSHAMRSSPSCPPSPVVDVEQEAGGRERFAQRLVEGPIDGDWALRQVAGEDAGCSLVFYGTVRREGRLGEVLHLDYEAYPDMVQAEFSKIAEEVFDEHAILRVAIEHSYGRVPLGGCSVAVAIAAAHRQDVFQASSAIMDRLKERVPLWKKEVCTDGSEWKGQGS